MKGKGTYDEDSLSDSFRWLGGVHMYTGYRKQCNASINASTSTSKALVQIPCHCTIPTVIMQSQLLTTTFQVDLKMGFIEAFLSHHGTPFIGHRSGIC